MRYTHTRAHAHTHAHTHDHAHAHTHAQYMHMLHVTQVLEEELYSLEELSAKIAHAIRIRTVAVATAGANAAVSPAAAPPRPGAALAEALATGRAIHGTTRRLSPSASSPPCTKASVSSVSPSQSPRLPTQCDSLPESPQLRRVLGEMGILEVEQQHMQKQAELLLLSYDA